MVWVKGISDCPPHLPSFKGDTIGSVSFSDWICLWGHWTQEVMLFLSRFSMSRNHYLKRFTSYFILEFLYRIFSKLYLTGSSTRPPKYSCRDCWTGVNPMKNDQSKPDAKPLWGLKSKPLTHKPKEERILDTVNRVISRIQNDERNCLWPNTLTRPAWGCR